jgi:hypothetical protein
MGTLRWMRRWTLARPAKKASILGGVRGYHLPQQHLNGQMSPTNHRLSTHGEGGVQECLFAASLQDALFEMICVRHMPYLDSPR